MGTLNGYTTLEYNGVQLRNCQTLKFSEVADKDPMGYVTSLQGTLRILGYFTAGQGHVGFGTYPQYGTHDGFNINQAPHSIYRALTQELLKSHGHLIYKFNDGPGHGGSSLALQNSFDPLIDIKGSPDGFELEDNEMTTEHDVSGGPHPVSVDVVQIAGSETWRVEFEIKYARRPRCRKKDDSPVVLDPEEEIELQYDSGEILSTDLVEKQNKLGVLSNTWSCMDSVDDAYFTTREIQGQVKLANPHWNPHDYRMLTLPPLHPAMVRSNVMFSNSPDNLTLSYKFTDREVYMTPPGDCVHVSVDYSENISLAGANDGRLLQFQIRADVAGDRLTSKSELVATAQALCDAKLSLQLLLNPALKRFGIMVNEMELSDHQGSDNRNTITMTMSGVRYVENNAAFAGQNPGLADQFANMGPRVAKKIGPLPGTILANYNNQRARGNRSGAVGFEQPDVEAGIPALSALASALHDRCTDNYGIWKAMTTQLDATAKSHREANIAQMDADDNEYNPSTIFDSETLVSLNEDPTAFSIPDVRFSQAHREAVYTSYAISARYSTDSMTYAMPVAGTTATFESPVDVLPTAVMRIAGDQTKKVLTIKAQRFGEPVQLPEFPLTLTETVASDSGPSPIVDDAVLIRERVIEEHLSPVPGVIAGTWIFGALITAVYIYLNAPSTRRMGTPATDAITGGTYSAAKPYTQDNATIFSSGWKLEK